VCFPGSTLCATLVACSGPGQNECPAGSICVVQSCCGYPICVTPDLIAACPPTTEEQRSFSRLAPRESVPGSAGG
jgi:hypothetical protein